MLYTGTYFRFKFLAFKDTKPKHGPLRLNSFRPLQRLTQSQQRVTEDTQSSPRFLTYGGKKETNQTISTILLSSLRPARRQWNWETKQQIIAALLKQSLRVAPNSSQSVVFSLFFCLARTAINKALTSRLCLDAEWSTGLLFSPPSKVYCTLP